MTIEQEPVAWIHNFIEGGISIGKRPADLNRHPDRWTALYKDPTPCQTCQALARTVMLDQTSHDTTPPQRTWVGLTDDELLKTYGWQFESYGQSDRPSSLGQSIVDEAKQEIIDGLRKVEAALKEKNNAK